MALKKREKSTIFDVTFLIECDKRDTRADYKNPAEFSVSDSPK